ncbi:MAG: hypothetical protein JNK38_20250 [Acidobacteria bacterium]|nr:hypothetical protein [Acidobacteriota bacterium]
MYCPKCAAQAVPGQRFCRNCGTNLGVILDAIDGKQPGPIDFEALKNNLRELGANLRAGFEQASAQIKNTKRLDQTPPTPMNQAANFPPPQIVLADMARDLKGSLKQEIKLGLNKVKLASSRKHSLQQATLSILGGGAWMVVWHELLNQAFGSGLLNSLEALILQKTRWEVVGLVPIFRMLWLLGLVPVAKGVAHLLNGIFFAPKPEQLEPEEPVVQQPEYYYPSQYAAPVSAVSPESYIASPTTNELNQKAAAQAQPSVTEDATLRFGDTK